MIFCCNIILYVLLWENYQAFDDINLPQDLKRSYPHQLHYNIMCIQVCFKMMCTLSASQNRIQVISKLIVMFVAMIHKILAIF